MGILVLCSYSLLNSGLLWTVYGRNSVRFSVLGEFSLDECVLAFGDFGVDFVASVRSLNSAILGISCWGLVFC